jgi:diguanylate cyclase (GGDEF)-like protein
MEEPAPFSGNQRRRARQFAVLGNLLPILVATLFDFSSHHTVFFIGAALSVLPPFLVTTFTRSTPIAFYGAAYGGLVSLTMMQAYSGGPASSYAVLMMMAMIWFGLQASDQELQIGLIVLAACCYLPMLVFGPPAYPVSWGSATLLLLVGIAVAGSLRSLTKETQKLHSRLRTQAFDDPLTGLCNRRGWENIAVPTLAQAARDSRDVGLILLDLDQLKEINDSFGHEKGDDVLRETADRMRTVLRSADVIARLGGDEFAALLSGAGLEEILVAAERLKAATPERGAFSAGAAGWNRSETLDELLNRADLALYAAKTAGGARIELAAKSFDDSSIPAQGD